jgi:PAS domain S-box-containing protein
VLTSWTDKLDKALAGGYAGTRVTGDTMWLEKKDWKDFMAYESAINEVIENQKLLVLCTYSLERCGVSEVIDVVTRHESGLVRREGDWEIIESQEQKRTSQALRQSEERYRALFDGMTEGFAVHDIICDDQGKPCDYRFLEANPSFERLTGLSRDSVLGRTVRQVIPDIDQGWIDTCGRVALTGQPVHVESYGSPPFKAVRSLYLLPG